METHVLRGRFFSGAIRFWQIPKRKPQSANAIFCGSPELWFDRDTSGRVGSTRHGEELPIRHFDGEAVRLYQYVGEYREYILASSCI